MRFLITSKEIFELGVFSRELLRQGNTVVYAQDGDEIDNLLTSAKIDALIDDDDETVRIRDLLRRFPMLNIALLSDKPHEEFHESTEGLGILAQLPTIPEKRHAEELVQQLHHIQGLTRQ